MRNPVLRIAVIETPGQLLPVSRIAPNLETDHKTHKLLSGLFIELLNLVLQFCDLHKMGVLERSDTGKRH